MEFLRFSEDKVFLFFLLGSWQSVEVLDGVVDAVDRKVGEYQERRKFLGKVEMIS